MRRLYAWLIVSRSHRHSISERAAESANAIASSYSSESISFTLPHYAAFLPANPLISLATRERIGVIGCGVTLHFATYSALALIAPSSTLLAYCKKIRTPGIAARSPLAASSRGRLGIGRCGSENQSRQIGERRLPYRQAPRYLLGLCALSFSVSCCPVLTIRSSGRYAPLSSSVSRHATRRRNVAASNNHAASFSRSA